MSEISRDELQKLIARGQVTLIDVLPRAYFRHSHLPGALSIPFDEIAVHLEQIVPDKRAEIVVYCLNLACPAAQIAAQMLAAMGYEKVREYRGGKDDWRASGLNFEGESRDLRRL